MFATTADPDRFYEAATYFSKLVVLTKDEAIALGEDAGRRAFWIGGGLQLSQVQRVFDEIKKAQDKGDSFEDWRKRVRKELTDDEHAETVFRNAIQRSLAAGRWAQMSDPNVVKFRPYWLFDAVLDTRTSSICRVCNGTIRPAGDQWWLTHTPPCHHRCRSGLRSLRRAEAEKRGITNVPPPVSAQDGFGLSPTKDPIWKPDPKKTDPNLLAELERKQKTRGKKPPPPPKQIAPPKEHDPRYWEEQYRKGAGVFAKNYGEAAPALGWGRAMLERALDRTPADILVELRRLQAAGHRSVTPVFIRDIEKLDQNRPLRSQPAATVGEIRGLALLQEHTRSISAAPFQVDTKFEAVKAAKHWYDLMLDRSVARPQPRIEHVAGARAHARGAGYIRLGDVSATGDTVAIHELAHTIEFADARALQRSLAFLRARTVGEKLRKLADITGSSEFRDDEESREDKFFDPYIGKDYGIEATEVTSMGYERMAWSGPYQLRRLLENDQDMLFFLLGQLAGR